SLVRTSHLHSPKPRRCRAMASSHDLLRLSFAAIRGTPKGPLIARTNRIHGVPEARRKAAIGWVLQYAHPFAVLDLPANLSPKLKVVALIVNGPRAVCLKQDCVVG